MSKMVGKSPGGPKEGPLKILKNNFENKEILKVYVGIDRRTL
jgi:hypothetical protein